MAGREVVDAAHDRGDVRLDRGDVRLVTADRIAARIRPAGPTFGSDSETTLADLTYPRVTDTTGGMRAQTELARAPMLHVIFSLLHRRAVTGVHGFRPTREWT